MAKITPEEWHNALNQALADTDQEAQNILGITPKSWEELSEEEQALISQATLFTNCVVSEFTDTSD